MKVSERTRVLSWAFYDWANSAFALTVMAALFPYSLRQHWALEMDSVDSTFLLGAVNTLASLLIVVLAPVLGAIADQASARRRFLFVFTAMGVVSTGALFLVVQGQWVPALVLYLFGVVGFSGANVFYDSLLMDVAPPSRFERVSSLGYALGYLGGGLLFVFNVLMLRYPHIFGLADGYQAVRYAFFSVAVWWSLFAVPLFLFVPERGAGKKIHWNEAVKGGFGQLIQTLHRIRQFRDAAWFLLAYWLYIDGVDTIVRMALDYGMALGLQGDSLMVALLITQFVGFPAALLFGRIGERYGPKQGIMIGIFVYFLVLLWAYRMQSEWEFYVLAGVIGLVQGGIQALSRALYARLIPAERSGEFFGFYNMLGKFAAVLGPITVGWVAVATGSARLSMLSISVLFVAGALVLARVPERPKAC